MMIIVLIFMVVNIEIEVEILMYVDDYEYNPSLYGDGCGRNILLIMDLDVPD